MKDGIGRSCMTALSEMAYCIGVIRADRLKGSQGPTVRHETFWFRSVVIRWLPDLKITERKNNERHEAINTSPRLADWSALALSPLPSALSIVKERDTLVFHRLRSSANSQSGHPQYSPLRSSRFLRDRLVRHSAQPACSFLIHFTNCIFNPALECLR